MKTKEMSNKCKPICENKYKPKYEHRHKGENKGLSAMHITMMALGTVVGGSFFLGVAIGIRSAGPAIVISYLLVGLLVYLILYALSEMTAADPSPGSFRKFAQREFGSGVGFVIGWLYWTGLVLAMSSEATAASNLLRIWFTNIPLPFFGTMIIVIVTALNLLGADKLSKLESCLAAIKLFAILGFIVMALLIISGAFIGRPAVGLGALKGEAFLPNGISGIFGSLLIVLFTYAGFEVIGLSASETDNPYKTIPKAITYTVVTLISLYTLAIIVFLPLIRTDVLTEDASPFVMALETRGITWAASIMNIVLITAILSTMLAAMFGLGRMIRSLAEEGYAPNLLKDKGEIPYRGIIFSGLSMLIALILGIFLPSEVYIFLVSSGGFSLLFTYLVILVTHYKFRKNNGCPPEGKCRFPGYPYTSYLSIIALISIIVTMPLIPGQGAGLVAGIGLIIFYTLIYYFFKRIKVK